jgi:NADPH-dependent 2,4-dienoyl-CoA reductase/sulfur reductase-like enzyme
LLQPSVFCDRWEQSTKEVLGGLRIIADDSGGELDEIQCVVIGAGVIGLATARALALAGREVVVLDDVLAQQRGNSWRFQLSGR